MPPGGLPLSLLSDLKEQIPCDFLLCHGYDTALQQYWFAQQIPLDGDGEGNGEPDEIDEEMDRVFWQQYWDSQVCNYPDRSGDRRSIVKVRDFYSVRQWHATGMYREVMRPQGLDNHIQMCLSRPSRTLMQVTGRSVGSSLLNRAQA